MPQCCYDNAAVFAAAISSKVPEYRNECYLNVIKCEKKSKCFLGSSVKWVSWYVSPLLYTIFPTAERRGRKECQWDKKINVFSDEYYRSDLACSMDDQSNIMYKLLFLIIKIIWKYKSLKKIKSGIKQTEHWTLNSPWARRSPRLINIFNRQVKLNSGKHYPDKPQFINTNVI